MVAAYSCPTVDVNAPLTVLPSTTFPPCEMIFEPAPGASPFAFPVIVELRTRTVVLVADAMMPLAPLCEIADSSIITVVEPAPLSAAKTPLPVEPETTELRSVALVVPVVCLPSTMTPLVLSSYFDVVEDDFGAARHLGLDQDAAALRRYSRPAERRAGDVKLARAGRLVEDAELALDPQQGAILDVHHAAAVDHDAMGRIYEKAADANDLVARHVHHDSSGSSDRAEDARLPGVGDDVDAFIHGEGDIFSGKDMDDPSLVGLRKRAAGAEYLPACGRRREAGGGVAAIAGNEGGKASVSWRGDAEQRDK